MKLSTVYLYLNYIRRKDPIGGSISIPQLNTLFPIVAFKFFKKIFGLPEQYQKGARDPILGFGLNNISEEKICPLKVLPATLSIDSVGYADYPAEYFYKAACYYVYSIPSPGTGTRDIQVPFVNDAKFNERRTTVLDPPQLKDPVANLHSVNIRFLPTDLETAYLEYIKFPTTPVMGYVIDSTTAENIYVNKGAYCEILTPGSAGDTVTLLVGAVTLGSYTTISGDTADDVMIGLNAAVNVGTLSHNVKAVYDGEKIVLIDLGETYITLTATPTGGITLNKTNFTQWSTQFDWENDVDSMNDICEMLLEMMGISNRDIPITQWAAQEAQK